MLVLDVVDFTKSCMKLSSGEVAVWMTRHVEALETAQFIEFINFALF